MGPRRRRTQKIKLTLNHDNDLNGPNLMAPQRYEIYASVNAARSPGDKSSCVTTHGWWVLAKG